MSPGVPALEACDLSIRARVDNESRPIASSVSLSVQPGETLGLVGESGSGKSLIARSLVGLLPPGVTATGSISVHGSPLESPSDFERVRGHQVALLLQDPFTMLHPLLRCGVHISEGLAPRHTGRRAREQVRAATSERLAEVGIHDPDVQDRYPFELSGGMRQRVALAAALARDPSVLVADEPSTALDSTTQAEILALLRSLQRSRGMAVLLITHDLRLAFSICDRVMVLYAGTVLEVGSASEIHREPAHPYTLALLLSEPPIERRVESLRVTPGAVPTAADVADECGFASRCEWATERCTSAKPSLAPVSEGRLSACVRRPEIVQSMRELRARASLYAAPRDVPERPVVAADSVTKVFAARRGRDAVAALTSVSIQVSVGETIGIVGGSGSGKTTLGRCIVGLERPTSGSITIDGIDASDYSSLSRSERQRVRGTVAMVFQDPYSTLNPVRSVASTLREALRHRDPVPRDVEGEMSRILSLVGLPAHYGSRKPVALSGGERQRVAIARALAIEPRVLVCDEAVSALDVSVQAQILSLLRRLQSELQLSYVFISHDLAVVRQIAHRIYVMHRGEVVESGNTEDVLDRPTHPYTTRLIESVPRAESAPGALAHAPSDLAVGSVERGLA